MRRENCAAEKKLERIMSQHNNKQNDKQHFLTIELLDTSINRQHVAHSGQS